MDLSPQHSRHEPDLLAHRARMASALLLPFDQLHILPKRPRKTGPRGLPRGLPRRSRPAPDPTRQYAQRMGARVMQDQRLTFSARALAFELFARAGKAGFATVKRRLLARKLGVCERTIGRGLAELRCYGYIATRREVDAIGMTRGLIVEVLDPLRPFWQSLPIPAFADETSRTLQETESLKRLREGKSLARTGSGTGSRVPRPPSNPSPA